jgi:hypothetical protein
MLREVHAYLFKKYTLLEQVIRARKLHHSRFYSLNLDYGHQHFLDTLANDRFIVLRALERIERRTAEVLYAQKKWFRWVRACQDEEDAHREKESKRIKKEAELLKRNMRRYEARRRELRAQEHTRQQDEYLDQAYRERLAMDEGTDDEDWDPIEDVFENERGDFVDLIKHFLWQDMEPEEASLNPGLKEPQSTTNREASQVDVSAPTTSGPSKSSVKGKSKKKNKNGIKKSASSDADAKSKVETRAEMRQRLKEGSKLSQKDGQVGILLRGTIENPVEISDRTFALPDDEIESLLEQAYEIRHLLFCRLLLSYASLLPAALHVNSVEEFLNDKDIPTADLKELCMKMEQPGLQEVRDACADLMRGEDEESDDDESEEEDKELAARKRRLGASGGFIKRYLPKSWSTKREKEFQKRRKQRRRLQEDGMGGKGAFIDFGMMNVESEFETKKMRVKVCGRMIHNYPSEKSMTRGGWLQFAIIAKDSKLFDCIELCRTWEEFFELSSLACLLYFPAADWCSWVGDQKRQQLLQLVCLSVVWGVSN